MSEPDYERPEADAAEQEQDAVPAAEEGEETWWRRQAPLEASEADTAEQDQILDFDDDERR
jgi:hypothetical protein